MIFVYYADYPTIFLIYCDGWVLVNLCASPNGKSLVFP